MAEVNTKCGRQVALHEIRCSIWEGSPWLCAERHQQSTNSSNNLVSVMNKVCASHPGRHTTADALSGKAGDRFLIVTFNC